MKNLRFKYRWGYQRDDPGLVIGLPPSINESKDLFKDTATGIYAKDTTNVWCLLVWNQGCGHKMLSQQKAFGVAMASIKHMALMMTALGVNSFILGIVAEHKKPASGSPVALRGGVICKYPSDPTVVLGFLSMASLTASVAFGFYSVLYPYNGKCIPRSALLKNTTFFVYFHIAVWVSLLSEGMLLWATITEHLHLTRNYHHNMYTKCPTAKTGLFGGGAFMALNACLFWLICLMLADNARDDYFDEQEENSKGEYGQVHIRDYEAKDQCKV